MTPNDMGDFVPALDKLLAMYDRKADDMVAEAWFDALEPFPLDWVLGAFKAYTRNPANGGLIPRPPAIVAEIQARQRALDGFLTGEQAWLRVPKTEGEAAWVYPEMLTAFSSDIEGGMGKSRFMSERAFVDAHDRLVEQARKEGRTARWFLSRASEGPYEERARLDALALSSAVQRGDLTAIEADELNGAPLMLAQPGRNDANETVARLEMAAKDNPTDAGRNALAALRGMFRQPAPPMAMGESNERKREAAERAARYAAERGIDLSKKKPPEPPEAAHG